MKLEQQVTSLELSKRLKELGVKQESLWVWSPTQMKDISHNLKLNRGDSSSEHCFAAFTVAELGEMLPDTITTTHFDDAWFVEYDAIPGEEREGFKNRCFTEDAEAEARAGMLIYLLDNKLITL